MGIFNSINMSATGLTAERTRMDIISKNIANANTTRTSSGTPYRRQMVVFEESKNKSFAEHLSNFTKSRSLMEKNGVKISEIVEDKSPFKKVYDPGHPDADKAGYVNMPNVDIVKEMVDMITATRSYEANITSIDSSKSMAMKAINIGK
ncbi:flagellar basal body rod protein FlgC [Sporosalibacterium faouarense]|uniref:flagellar basal body rod protein FlgC n=1 Tax=Sporosalibacterium faouarense TaxID=516123 RepID=UPI00141CBC42|nr:flagellar basal body rod protein FlgC [Sporosalibacterium faouarense]MTI47984.1 flagellar basal body rod protein FlgC [Bacillota bacterium]